jgi:4-oxalocrotonate tautomerase
MPIVTIEQSEGRTVDQKRRVSELVTSAFVEAYGLRPEQVTILFHELSLDNMAKEGILYSDRE